MSFAGAGVGIVLDYFLDDVPGVDVYDGFAIVFDDEVTEFENADENFVGKECFVRVEGAEDVGLGVDLGEGGSGCAHFEGAFDAGDHIGIWDPTIGDVGRAVAPGADFYGLAFEADGRCAWDAAMFEDEVAQTAFCIG